MWELKKAGAVALSDDGKPIMNAGIMRLALQYARGFDMLIISHCEDLQLTGDGVMNEGYMSTVLGVKRYNPCRRGSDGSPGHYFGRNTENACPYCPCQHERIG